MKMSEKEKFFFVPVKRREKVESQKKPAISIHKNGNISLNKIAVRNYFPTKSYVRIFVDEPKRVIGLKSISKNITQEQLKEARKISSLGSISCAGITKLFMKIEEKFSNIPLQKYEDDIYGEIWYFKFPVHHKITEDKKHDSQ